MRERGPFISYALFYFDALLDFFLVPLRPSAAADRSASAAFAS